tara:strand:- start:3418 stop:3807 length:390 start_codon:yes stop_codon:yes gene_type:complete
MIINADISLGELVDKITILKIKMSNITDKEKLNNINIEHSSLLAILDMLQLDNINRYIDELIIINQELWDIEDKIRVKESVLEFDEEFITLARSVYVTNDKRFEIKSDINTKYGSEIKEEKEYEDYNEN